MNDRIEGLLRSADFTKESDLYGKLKNDLFGNKTVDFLSRRRLSENDLEMLTAAGVSERSGSPPIIISEDEED